MTPTAPFALRAAYAFAAAAAAAALSTASFVLPVLLFVLLSPPDWRISHRFSRQRARQKQQEAETESARMVAESPERAALRKSSSLTAKSFKPMQRRKQINSETARKSAGLASARNTRFLRRLCAR